MNTIYNALIGNDNINFNILYQKTSRSDSSIASYIVRFGSIEILEPFIKNKVTIDININYKIKDGRMYEYLLKHNVIDLNTAILMANNNGASHIVDKLWNSLTHDQYLNFVSESLRVSIAHHSEPHNTTAHALDEAVIYGNDNDIQRFNMFKCSMYALVMASINWLEETVIYVMNNITVSEVNLDELLHVWIDVGIINLIVKFRSILCITFTHIKRAINLREHEIAAFLVLEVHPDQLLDEQMMCDDMLYAIRSWTSDYSIRDTVITLCRKAGIYCIV